MSQPGVGIIRITRKQPLLNALMKINTTIIKHESSIFQIFPTKYSTEHSPSDAVRNTSRSRFGRSIVEHRRPVFVAPRAGWPGELYRLPAMYLEVKRYEIVGNVEVHELNIGL